MVDTISSLASIDYRHDEWRVDVTVAGSQKGLMLPPGLSFNAVSAKALAAAKTARLPRSYWDWNEMIAINPSGYFPYTPATNLLYGLARRARHAVRGRARPGIRAPRPARRGHAAGRHAPGGSKSCAPTRALYSSTLTAVVMPEGHNADAFRKVVLERFDMSLGQGLGKVAGKIFRIGHLGAFQRPDALRHARRRRDGAGSSPASRTGRAAPRRRSTISRKPRGRRSRTPRRKQEEESDATSPGGESPSTQQESSLNQ